jgi:phosphate:Na+ symporter
METLISVLGGVGLFLLGMSIMTAGLKSLAGPRLRATLRKAAATPLSGTFWGAFVTLIVQSSSATTMTTIGLVSAGLLTFAQGLALVFGANIGTTGTAWLIALIGVRVSLTAAALPMIFVGALATLLGKGRLAASGSTLAGFALILFGLTTLQQGMGGAAELLHPSNLPAVLGSGTGWWSGLFGVLALILAGLAMTAVMQSSTAAVAVTLSAYFAGAVGLDQACALIIGQNIGTATSSALAAIGASSTAKRLALAYVLFKIVAASIALVLFPITTPLLMHLAKSVDGVTLLAAYHTAFNVVGVVVLLPLIEKFTRFVERILPERAEPGTRFLDRAALETPLAAEEAVRRTVAHALADMCRAVSEALLAGLNAVSVAKAADALQRAREFMSEVSAPPESKDEQERLTHTLFALTYAVRLAEVASDSGELDFGAVPSGVDEMRARELCVEAMQNAVLIAESVISPPTTPARATKAKASSQPPDSPAEHAMIELEYCAIRLEELRQPHRDTMLRSIAGGETSADTALARVDAIRRLEVLAYNAWRATTHLVTHHA